jgi:hypothetical protein
MQTMWSMGQPWSAENRWQHLEELRQSGLHRQCGRALEKIAVRNISEIRVRPHVIANPIEASELAEAAEKGRKPSKWAYLTNRAEEPAEDVTLETPLIARLVSTGLAVRLYLTALYEAQVRQHQGMLHTNNRPIVPKSTDEVGWLDLLAVTTKLSDMGFMHPGNRLNKVNNAIKRVHEEGVVMLPSENKPRHKLEHFLLRNDGGTQPGLPTRVRYIIPKPDEGVGIPVEFYTNNWLHFLTNGEIAMWLALRLLAGENSEAHQDSGVFMSTRISRLRFGLTLDRYRSHAALARFGLIKGVGNESRWRVGQPVPPGQKGQLEPLHFALDDRGLGLPADEVIGAALQSEL